MAKPRSTRIMEAVWVDVRLTKGIVAYVDGFYGLFWFFLKQEKDNFPF